MFMLAPGDCSPSLKVVSNMNIFSDIAVSVYMYLVILKNLLKLPYPDLTALLPYMFADIPAKKSQLRIRY